MKTDIDVYIAINNYLQVYQDYIRNHHPKVNAEAELFLAGYRKACEEMEK